MSNVLRQAVDLTQIRRLIEQSFTKDPYDIDRILYDLLGRIKVGPGREIIYNEETKFYQVHTYDIITSLCKICNNTKGLKEIPTQGGQFYLCPFCYKDIITTARSVPNVSSL